MKVNRFELAGFRQELSLVCAASTRNHPHLCTIYHFDGSRGRTLRQLIASRVSGRSPLPIDEFLEPAEVKFGFVFDAHDAAIFMA